MTKAGVCLQCHGAQEEVTVDLPGKVFGMTQRPVLLFRHTFFFCRIRKMY